VHLHALTSLQAHAQQLLPDAVAQARDQGLPWPEIGQLLGVSAATAAHRYRNER
jgi:nucleotide-binding universal stress UspA family protein